MVQPARMYINYALGYLVAANILAFGIFWLDKRAAVNDGWRISEAKLLAVSLCGGWIGAKIAQRVFRHKTRKQPFGKVLNCIPMMWLASGLMIGAVSAAPPLAELAAKPEPKRTASKFFQSANH